MVKRLSAISQALLTLPGNNATQIMGSPDDIRLRSAMSLFALLPDLDRVFEAVFKKFFDGEITRPRYICLASSMIRLEDFILLILSIKLSGEVPLWYTKRA